MHSWLDILALKGKGEQWPLSINFNRTRPSGQGSRRLILRSIKKFFREERSFIACKDRSLAGFTPLETIGTREKTKRSLTGFTLIEVTITIFLVSFGFALLLRALSMAMSTDKYLEYRITALNLASEKMEEIKSTSFGSIGSDSESAGSVGFAFIDNRLTTVSLVDGDGSGSADPDLKKADVEVYWTQKGAQNKVKIETLICNY